MSTPSRSWQPSILHNILQEALNNKWTMEVFKVRTKQNFNVSIFFTLLLIVLQIKKKNASKSYKPGGCHPEDLK